MSKMALQPRGMTTSPRPSRLKIQKPEISVYTAPQAVTQNLSAGIFFKFLIVATYVFSAAALYLAFSI